MKLLPARSCRSPRFEVSTAQKRGDAERKKLPREMLAHRDRCLLVFLRIELDLQRGLRFRQHRRRYRPANQMARRRGKQRPVTDCKKTETKSGEKAPINGPGPANPANGIIPLP